jgi:pyridoxamine 5'-phosphate oxidase
LPECGQLTPDGQLRTRYWSSQPARTRWGGFRVLPARVEFWQEAPDGLHDRIRYRQANGGWITERLSP